MATNLRFNQDSPEITMEEVLKKNQDLEKELANLTKIIHEKNQTINKIEKKFDDYVNVTNQKLEKC